MDGINKYALASFDASATIVNNKDTIGYYAGKAVLSYRVDIGSGKCTLFYADKSMQIITLKEAKDAKLMAPPPPPPPMKNNIVDNRKASNHYIDLNPAGNYQGKAVLRISRNRKESVSIMFENNEYKNISIAEAKKSGLPIPPSPTEKSLDKIFTKTEIEPEFPGGKDAWRKYLQSNLDGSIAVKQNLKNGSYVFVTQFIVHEDGSLSDFTSEKNVNDTIAKYCIDVIKKGPRWKPAIQNGYVVAAYRKQAITFVVASEDVKPSASIVDPVFRIGNLTKSRIPVGEFITQKYATVSDNYELNGATVYFAGNGFPKVEMAKLYGNNLTKLKGLFDKCLAGTNIVFTNIKVKNSLGLRVIDDKAYSLY